jgi:hypothetical protein
MPEKTAIKHILFDVKKEFQTQHVTLNQTYSIGKLHVTLFTSWVALGGLVVRVLATGPRFTGSNPAEGDGFIMATKSVA